MDRTSPTSNRCPAANRPSKSPPRTLQPRPSTSARAMAKPLATKRPSPGRPTASKSPSSPIAPKPISSSSMSPPQPAARRSRRRISPACWPIRAGRPTASASRFSSPQNLPHRAGPLDPVPPDSGVLESKIYEQRIAVVDLATGIVAPDFARQHVHLRVRLVARRPQLRRLRRARHGRQQLVDRADLHAARGRRRTESGLQTAGGAADRRAALDARRQIDPLHRRHHERRRLDRRRDLSRRRRGRRRHAASRRASHRPSADIAAPRKSKYIYFSEHYDGGSAVSQIDPATGQIERLWKGDETIFTMDGGGVSLSDDGKIDRRDPQLLAARARSLGRPGRRLAQADARQ